jgi:hypothetical protein
MNGKYTVELCRPGGEDAGIERVFERQDYLAIARKLSTRSSQTNIQIASSCYVIALVCWHAATSPTECRIDPEERHMKKLRVLASR